jgi:hypothetical protein
LGLENRGKLGTFLVATVAQAEYFRAVPLAYDPVDYYDRIKDLRLYEGALKREVPLSPEQFAKAAEASKILLETANSNKDRAMAARVFVLLEQLNQSRERLEAEKAGMLRAQHQHVHLDLSKMSEEEVMKLAERYRQRALPSAGTTITAASSPGAESGGGDRERVEGTPRAEAGGDGGTLDGAIESLNLAISRAANSGPPDAGHAGASPHP